MNPSLVDALCAVHTGIHVHVCIVTSDIHDSLFPSMYAHFSVCFVRVP